MTRHSATLAFYAAPWLPGSPGDYILFNQCDGYHIAEARFDSREFLGFFTFMGSEFEAGTYHAWAKLPDSLGLRAIFGKDVTKLVGFWKIAGTLGRVDEWPQLDDSLETSEREFVGFPPPDPGRIMSDAESEFWRSKLLAPSPLEDIHGPITCNYPHCGCPFDHPGTEGWCAQGRPVA
jgi:hypothetical protein